MSSASDRGHEPPQIRIFSADEDYGIVRGWWEGHNWSAVPEAVLPKLGVVCSIKDKDTAAAWLYMDNSVGVSMLEWIVTNPENTGRESLKSIKFMVGFLKQQALSLDYGVMLASCRQESLLKVLEKSGFGRTDENVYHAVSLLR